MFGPLGVPELIFILVLALLIFGPKKLPEIGRTLGKGLGEFRRASEDLKRSFNAEMALDEEERRLTARRPSPASPRPAAGSAPRPVSREVEEPPSPSAEVGAGGASSPEEAGGAQVTGEEEAETKAEAPPEEAGSGSP